MSNFPVHRGGYWKCPVSSDLDAGTLPAPEGWRHTPVRLVVIPM